MARQALRPSTLIRTSTICSIIEISYGEFSGEEFTVVFDFKWRLRRYARTHLPKFAVPLFLRHVQAPFSTHNNKQNKLPLKHAGVDPDKMATGERCSGLRATARVPLTSRLRAGTGRSCKPGKPSCRTRVTSNLLHLWYIRRYEIWPTLPCLRVRVSFCDRHPFRLPSSVVLTKRARGKGNSPYVTHCTEAL